MSHKQYNSNKTILVESSIFELQAIRCENSMMRKSYKLTKRKTKTEIKNFEKE